MDKKLNQARWNFHYETAAQITFLNASGTLWLLKRGIQGLFMALTQYIFILPENTDGLLLSVVQCRLRTFALLSQQS